MLYKEMGVQKLSIRYNRSEKYFKPYEVLCKSLVTIPDHGGPQYALDRIETQVLLVDSFSTKVEAENFIKHLEGLDII